MVLSSVQHLGASESREPVSRFLANIWRLFSLLNNRAWALEIIGQYNNVIEGLNSRELFSDVSSFSLLVSSSVAG